MRAAIGVERTEQAVRLDRLMQAAEARHRAFFGHEKRRINPARRIVHRHDQVDVVTQRRDPAVRRAILHQHHANHRAADPLLAMFAASGRGLHIARPLQRQARDRVAQGVVVMAAQFLVKVFDREVLVSLVIQTPHPGQFALRRPAVRNTAEPFVAQTVDTFGLVTDALAAEVAGGQTQQFARFLRGQTTFLMAGERIQETPHVRLP